MDIQDQEILLRTIEETQRLLRCSRSTVYELGNSGRLQFVKLGRSTRVNDASIRTLVEQLIEQSRANTA
jgi:excisionase family DNA binding protein